MQEIIVPNGDEIKSTPPSIEIIQENLELLTYVKEVESEIEKISHANIQIWIKSD